MSFYLDPEDLEINIRGDGRVQTHYTGPAAISIEEEIEWLEPAAAAASAPQLPTLLPTPPHGQSAASLGEPVAGAPSSATLVDAGLIFSAIAVLLLVLYIQNC